MMGIVERYIFRQLIFLFSLFLVGFYLLYILIDYTSHMHEVLRYTDLALTAIAHYYGLQLIKWANILFPLALSIASIQVLSRLNTHRELLAFQSAGIRLKRLTRPFILLGCVCGAVILAMQQWALPYALNSIQTFDSRIDRPHRKGGDGPFHVIHLKDQSRLVYQHYDSDNRGLFDVIWIRTSDDIWKMRHLSLSSEQPQGLWVDHLKRNSEGILEKVESFRDRAFDQLTQLDHLQQTENVPLENHSISHLWKRGREAPPQQREAILTHLLFKLSTPLLPLVMVLGISVYCTRFSKTSRAPQIYAVAVFGFATLIALIDAAVILGESATLSPLHSIVLPLTLLVLLSGWKFYQMEKM